MSSEYDDDVTVVDFEGGTGDQAATVERLRRAGHLLDSAVEIPGTSYRIGLDPIVGLIPGVGDAATTLASVYIVVEAARLGVPRETLARMVLTLAVDAVVGGVPLLGDAFDAVWKANDRNVALLERRLAEPTSGQRDRWVLLAFGAGVFLTLLAISVAAVLAAGWVLARVGVV